MGMGEPFDNLEQVLKSLEILTSDWGFAMSPRRITVSTVGIIPGMLTFLDRSEAHLAVSLHTPFDEERRKLMPVQIAYPLKDVIREIKSWDFGRQRRVSFEYIVFKGMNDTPQHVKELARLLDGIKCRINLIRFHPIPGTRSKGTDEQTLRQFKDLLNDKGILTTIRASRGQEFMPPAACYRPKNCGKEVVICSLNCIFNEFHPCKEQGSTKLKSESGCVILPQINFRDPEKSASRATDIFLYLG
jgi:23S rRNA (adenine2503-C2)-methyltransferase